MDTESIKALVQKKVPGLDHNRPLLDQLDSVQLVVLISELENSLGVCFRLDEINPRTMSNLQEFARFLFDKQK